MTSFMGISPTAINELALSTVRAVEGAAPKQAQPQNFWGRMWSEVGDAAGDVAGGVADLGRDFASIWQQKQLAKYIQKTGFTPETTNPDPQHGAAPAQESRLSLGGAMPMAVLAGGGALLVAALFLRK